MGSAHFEKRTCFKFPLSVSKMNFLYYWQYEICLSNPFRNHNSVISCGTSVFLHLRSPLKAVKSPYDLNIVSATYLTTPTQKKTLPCLMVSAISSKEIKVNKYMFSSNQITNNPSIVQILITVAKRLYKIYKLSGMTEKTINWKILKHELWSWSSSVNKYQLR